jgi:flavin-dependent dehydrogenase
MYDVLVAGAGPAGSTAAKILAEKGMRVLLAEKEKLPRYKSCSGQLIGKTLELTKAYFGEPVPLSVTCEPAQSRGMVLTNDKGRSFRFEQKGLNVWRSAFDHCPKGRCSRGGNTGRDSGFRLPGRRRTNQGNAAKCREGL